MIDLTTQGLAAVAAAAMCGCAWLLRRRSRERADARVGRLERAAALTARHAAALERFLGAEEPADDLKRLLLDLRSRPGPVGRWRTGEAVEGPELQRLEDALARLHRLRPDLEEEFWTALDTAVMAGALIADEAPLPLMPTSGSPSHRLGMALAAAHPGAGAVA